MNYPNKEIDYSNERKYSGYGLFNTIFFALIAVPLITLLLFFSDKKIPFIVVPINTFLWDSLLYFLGIKRYNYFIINDKALIVKNIFWPYKHIIIYINDISETNIEMKGSGSRSIVMVLSVRRKDLSLETYWSDSLTLKNWRDLRNDLIHAGIQVNVNAYIGRLD